MKQKGFTLVELLLATALFSFVLLFVTASFVQINRAYNKGITVKRVQESARTVISDMSRSISSASSVNGGVVVNSNCLIAGGVRYVWNTGLLAPYTSNTYNVVRDYNINCSDPVDSSSTQLIDPKVAVRALSITPVGPGDAYRITVELEANKDNGSGNPCDQITDTYCDRARLSTIVTLRS